MTDAERRAAAAEEALERLLYSVSHDLNEPVRKIGAFTELLMRHVEVKDPQAERYAGYVTDAAKRLRQMIDAMLYISRIGRLDKPWITMPAGPVIEQAWREAQHRHGASGKLVVAELPDVQAEPGQWLRVWQELLDNAVKFRHPDRPLEVRVEAAGDPLRFVVTDNGQGLPEGPTDKAFDLFRSLHARGAFPGVGAGLAIVAAAARNHGGDLGWVPHEHGASLFFTWPGRHQAHGTADPGDRADGG